MAVLMADRPLGVQRRGAGTLDAHGDPAGGAWGPLLGPWAGAAREMSDGSWSLRVDPSAWPLRAGDLVVEQGVRSWLVTAADLIRNNLDSTVDYIRVTGRERVGAATEPAVAPQPTTHN